MDYKVGADRMHTITSKKLLTPSIIFICFIILAFVAGGFFKQPPDCSKIPVKSDAVILFAGPDFETREKKAHELLDQGYASVLIIPFFKMVLRQGAESLSGIDAFEANDKKNYKKKYPAFYEATHIEILDACELMHAGGFQSAIMVSSTYHMKRIRLISERILGEHARSITYVSAPPLRELNGFWGKATSIWKFRILEFIKICWFCMYSPFG
jgi:hypothetical protein